MFVLSQNKNVIVNLNNATDIQLDLMGDGHTNEIYANLIDACPETLGVYITEERAREVFLKLIEHEGVRNVFEMPEE